MTKNSPNHEIRLKNKGTPKALKDIKYLQMSCIHQASFLVKTFFTVSYSKPALVYLPVMPQFSLTVVPTLVQGLRYVVENPEIPENNGLPITNILV